MTNTAPTVLRNDKHDTPVRNDKHNDDKNEIATAPTALRNDKHDDDKSEIASPAVAGSQ